MPGFGAFERRISAVDSLLCVGLDPAPERLPEAVARTEEPRIAFNRRIIEATHEYTAAYKPNLAFYEDPSGWAALEATVRAAHEHDVPVVLDAKRGDVGHTAARYAELLEHTGAEAITVSPYLGTDGIRPFLDHGAVFLLCRTSNPSAGDLQSLTLADGTTVYERVADLAAEIDGAIGLVVGATAPSELVELRARVPDLPFLVPGVGAQGGDLEEAARTARASGVGLVNSSRGIIFAGESSEGDAFFEAAGRAAASLRDGLRAAAD